jgi:hypothetical protein
MSRGRYLSLEEARIAGRLDQFAKEHPSEAERERFERLLEAMAKGILEDKGTSPPDVTGGSSETRTRKGI